MTTQNTQQDQSDVDATVVEHPSTPEAVVDSIASETTISPEAEEQVDTSSIGPAAPAPASELDEKPAEASDETTPSSIQQSEQVEQSQEAVSEDVTQGEAIAHEEQENTSVESPAVHEETPAVEVPVAEAEKSHGEFPYRDVLSFAKEQEKEVRPFTAFIEEFRLAEEQARRQVSLPESPVEPLNLQDETASQETATAPEETPAEEQTAVVIQEQVVVSTTDAVAEVKAEETAPAEEASAADPIAETTAPSVEAASTSPEPEKKEEIGSELPVAEKIVPTPPPPERAVSPLLRPASRVRAPRHVRHLREEATVEPTSRLEEVPIASSEKTGQPEATTAQPLLQEKGATEKDSEKDKQIESPAVVEPPAPRPARRYRFDRPATNNTSSNAATAASARVEESKDALSRTLSNARSEAGAIEQAAETNAKKSSGALQKEQKESATSKQHVQEPPAQDATVAPATPETGRRRGHDRQKEAAPVTPIVEPVNPTVEPATMQAGEIAPEDLPPLEYAELQKTTTRRRRRHRSSSSNGTSAAAETPSPASSSPSVVPPTTPGATPPSPDASRSATNGAASGNNYSIVSGYTVSQMNLGNDTSGPFMGPDPSPARGSVLSRDSRTTNRTDTHRTPTPLYPGRTHTQEGGLTSAAFNQLTNSLVQALQNQTDRMVAELRRSNGAPTNVSVSLPPFPSTERVGVFVDVANLLYSARTLRISVDFGKLLDFLRGNRRLVRAHAYCPTSPQAGDEQMFLRAVKGLGYRITTKDYKTFSSGAKKADLDLDLCMDVVRLVDGRSVDCIVLVSGDSDFMPMLDYCSDHGVRVEVAAFDEAMSATLRQSCDLFVNLSMLEEIRS